MSNSPPIGGKKFVCSLGSETTPLTARAYDKDQPEFILSIPVGTGVWVRKVDIQLESFSGTDNEIVLWSTTNEIGNGTSSAPTETPTCTNALQSVVALAVPRQLYTANVTLTDYRELARRSNPLADVNINRFVMPEEESEAFFVPGASSVGFAISSTTTQATFYAKIYWTEVHTQS
jgi:hypothetical protein